MGNNSQLYIFLLIAAFSFVNWIVGKIKEEREIRKINESRKRQRESEAMSTSAPTNPELAEQRKARLRALREAQAQRTREQVRVLTGQPPRAKQPQTKRPTARPAPLAKPARAARPQPSTPGAPPTRRPLRPGRTARRTAIADRPAPTSRTQPVPKDPNHTVLGALDHKALPSEGGKATETTKPTEKLKRSGTDWKRAIVLSEILAPPVSLRKLDA